MVRPVGHRGARPAWPTRAVARSSQEQPMQKMANSQQVNTPYIDVTPQRPVAATSGWVQRLNEFSSTLEAAQEPVVPPQRPVVPSWVKMLNEFSNTREAVTPQPAVPPQRPVAPGRVQSNTREALLRPRTIPSPRNVSAPRAPLNAAPARVQNAVPVEALPAKRPKFEAFAPPPQRRYLAESVVPQSAEMIEEEEWPEFDEQGEMQEEEEMLEEAPPAQEEDNDWGEWGAYVSANDAEHKDDASVWSNQGRAVLPRKNP